MRILYTPVGDTDPIRGCYDGGMLHIVRHYNPDMAILVLSKDMEQKEASDSRFSKALKHVKADLDIKLIYTGLEDVHRIDTLQPFVDHFYEMLSEYPDAEILINLSSGTPQMKLIMSYLSVEHDAGRGIQVDSPQGGSNRSEPAVNDDEDIEIVIENNFDDQEDTENRCHEPQMGYIKRNNLKQSLHTLINSYKYKEAISLYEHYKKTFTDELDNDILALLEHGKLRLELEYKLALEKINRVGDLSLKSVFTDWKRIKLHEFLMLMEVRLKQGQIEDFILKITPFMYELMLYYFSTTYHVKWDEFEKWTPGGPRTDMVSFKEKHPQLYSSWYAHTKTPQFNEIQLSLNHMLHMLEDQPNVNPLLLKQLNDIRHIERKIRNKIAHEVVVLTEVEICKSVSIKSLQSFLELIQTVFSTIMKPSKQNELIYDTINTYVLEQIQ
ncbi:MULTISPECIES: type III-A CRISPR-associated CARF protein Csm6 [Veillonella]|uniref:CRISPR-associated protein Csm6 n=1 Tax=Veillonella hominis TaxID=2764330 RepID=A0ABR7JV71_9FIRM|nr:MULTISPECIES: CRISPR-associated protein Csm6 [Veillonella]MBC6000746.1 CRISPR-associated protein Csm6 [Veillonella hominis]RJU18164.1 CRISPR-associated protein Csm6 [Veillonella sp. AF36-20BH]